MAEVSGFLSELRRRKVLHTAAVYAMAAGGLWGAAEVAVPALGLPDAVITFVVVATLLGFPVALSLAWFFEVVPEKPAAPAVEDRHEDSRGLDEDAEGHDLPIRHRWGLVGTGVVGVAAVSAVVMTLIRPAVFGGPGGAGASEIDPGLLLVLPFRVTSADTGVHNLREGILDLLLPYLTERPRMFDARAAVANARAVGGGEDKDLTEDRAVELASSLGTGLVALGSAIGSTDDLAVSVRLLRVPGGEVLGDVTTQGDAGDLWELGRDLAGRMMTLIGGEEPARLEYLASVPLQAVQEYLEGQRVYRRGDFFAAAEHFVRALETDSTFALAALGLRHAADQMPIGVQGRFVSQAVPILERHLDRLPPRDRLFAEFMLGMYAFAPAVERAEEAARLVEALPDNAEAWHHLGSRLFQTWRLVAATDYLERADAAWRRVEALDPGRRRSYYLVIPEALGDTARLRRETEDFVAGAVPGEVDLQTRLLMAYALGDTVQRRWILEAMDTLSTVRLISMRMGGDGVGPPDVPQTDIDRWLEALRTSPVTRRDRLDATTLRYRVFRSLGRTAEAEAELRRRGELVAEVVGMPMLAWLMDPLYWEGDAEEGLAWMGRLREEYGQEGGAIGRGSAVVVTLWKIWEIREGRRDEVDWAIGRLREAARDPEPPHAFLGAIGALILETWVTHERGDAGADSLVAELRRVVEQGHEGFGIVANLELARILEARGEYLAAARAVFRPSTGYSAFPWGSFLSTMVHEGGRLYDLAGEHGEALYLYRWYLLLRTHPDPHLQPEADRIGARVAELEAEGIKAVAPGR